MDADLGLRWGETLDGEGNVIKDNKRIRKIGRPMADYDVIRPADGDEV